MGPRVAIAELPRAELARPAPDLPVVLLPGAVFVGGAVATAVAAVLHVRPTVLWSSLPVGPVMGGSGQSLLAAAWLFVVGILLLRAKRVGLWLAAMALGGGLVVHGAQRHDVVALIAAVALLAILAGSRTRYSVAAGRNGSAFATFLVGAGAVLIATATLHHPTDGGTAAAAVTSAIAAWVDGGIAGRSLAAPGSPVGLVAAFVIARALQLGGAVVALRAASAPARIGTNDAAHDALARSGRGGLLPYLGDPLVELCTDDDGQAVMAFARAGRIAVALGDPAGPPAAAVRLLAEWEATCRRSDWLPAIYQASATWRSLLRPRGWRAVGIGAEAIVDPTAFEIGSARLANVRHTVARARRAGLVSRWIHGGDASRAPDPEHLQRLVRVDAAWRQGNGLRLGFTVGSLDIDRLGGTLTIAAVDGAGEVAACIVIRPTGADGGWVLDVMRRAPGSPPGAVETCVVDAIEFLARSGSHRLSLGLAPLAHLEATSAAERLLGAGANLLRPLYDVRGLAFFKDKFAPTWEPRFLLVRHLWVVPGALIALVRLHLGGSWRAVMSSVRIRPT